MMDTITTDQKLLTSLQAEGATAQQITLSMATPADKVESLGETIMVGIRESGMPAAGRQGSGTASSQGFASRLRILARFASHEPDKEYGERLTSFFHAINRDQSTRSGIWDALWLSYDANALRLNKSDIEIMPSIKNTIAHGDIPSSRFVEVELLKVYHRVIEQHELCQATRSYNKQLAEYQGLVTEFTTLSVDADAERIDALGTRVRTAQNQLKDSKAVDGFIVI